MNRMPLSYEELTPLEQCIANRAMFAAMLRGEMPQKKRSKKPVRECAEA